MKNHVVSLELAKQLKEAGYTQSGEFDWIRKNPNQKHALNIGIGTWQSADKEGRVIAPLATELLEQLPAVLSNESSLEVDVLPHSFEVVYEEFHFTKSKSLPDALAEMWLWLKENNLL